MCQSHTSFSCRQREVVFNEKKMNKILQNFVFKNKKKEERKKCIDELDEMHRRRRLLLMFRTTTTR